MTKSTHKVTAGLVFLGSRTFDIVRIGNQISKTLDWLDEPTTGLRILSDCAATLQTDRFDVALEIETDRKVATLEAPAAQYLALRLISNDVAPQADEHLTLSIMAHVLRVLHGSLSPDYVQWVHPLAVLSHAEFLAAVTPRERDEEEDIPQPDFTPQKAAQAARSRLPDIEATNQVLQARFGSRHEMVQSGGGINRDLRAVFREPEDGDTAVMADGEAVREETAPLRLAVWMMTITLALFALPVAAGLAVFNLLRGENLRLASQTAALTGLFTTLQVHGATAQVLETVQGMLG
ncbi:hypothetical protein [uncultured Roseovarius sp.]|uniref:hypothetical protein n=1 Tax=uncultured Roseovarius sp. TaxID=293344 RepID=UPI00262CA08E|nr:hypothetical protein [uncultured Roseovarius sp.]